MKTVTIVISTVILTMTAVLTYLSNVTGVEVGLPVQGYLGAFTQFWIVLMVWATGFVTSEICSKKE